LITIEYGSPAGTLHANEDHILFAGASGQQRTIVVKYATLDSLLRDSSMSIANVNVLFPSAKYLGDLANVNDYPNNPLLVSAIILPNGLQYTFRYNPYGELARATLPTGGSFEYDWLPYTQSFGGVPADGIYGSVMIYRRVMERRVYGGTGALEQKTVYDAPLLTDPAPNLIVTATDQDANSNPLRKTVSTFWGTPLTSATIPLSTGAYFPGWREGKLHIDEVDSAAGALLRKTENTWMNRGSGGSSIDPSNDFAAPSDPRVTQIDTTLDGNQVSRQAFAYDMYNNITDKKEYDWGAGSPGGLLRHTQTSYVGGDYIASHLLNLPDTTTVSNASDVMVAKTHFGYDEYQGSDGSLVDTPGIVNHDANYHTGAFVRGNLTNPATFVVNDQSQWIPINHVRRYDIAGNVVRQSKPSSDPRNSQQGPRRPAKWRQPDMEKCPGVAGTSIGYQINGRSSSPK
jgi:YD repeat-containing protein